MIGVDSQCARVPVPGMRKAFAVKQMAEALQKHLATLDALECGRKRQAAYIIEDIDPLHCVAWDPEAHETERIRRDTML